MKRSRIVEVTIWKDRVVIERYKPGQSPAFVLHTYELTAKRAVLLIMGLPDNAPLLWRPRFT